MKTLLAFFSGGLVTTLAVFLAGGYHAAMLILGGFLTVVALVAIVWALGIPRVARWLLAVDSANSETAYMERGVRRANAGKPLAIAHPRWRAPKRNNRQRRTADVVNLTGAKMLSTVQQDVVSALVNLKMPFSQAERIVLEAHKTGDSFEDLFKRATCHHVSKWLVRNYDAGSNLQNLALASIRESK